MQYQLLGKSQRIEVLIEATPAIDLRFVVMQPMEATAGISAERGMRLLALQAAGSMVMPANNMMPSMQPMQPAMMPMCMPMAALLQ